MLIGDIVSIGYHDKKVLGVVLTFQKNEYRNPYYIIAVSALEPIDENIEELKRLSLEELLLFETMSCNKNEVKYVDIHLKKKELLEKTLIYKRMYQAMSLSKILESTGNLLENSDIIQRYVLLDVAGEKGVYDIATKMMYKYSNKKANE